MAFDQTHGQYFYFCAANGATSWEYPTATMQESVNTDAGAASGDDGMDVGVGAGVGAASNKLPRPPTSAAPIPESAPPPPVRCVRLAACLPAHPPACLPACMFGRG